MHSAGLPGIYASYVINKSRPQVRDKPMTKVLHEYAVAKVLILSFFFGASSHLFFTSIVIIAFPTMTRPL